MTGSDADEGAPPSGDEATLADPHAATAGIGAAPGHAEDPVLKASVQARLFGEASEAPTIGRYAILKVLGEGGMGTVFACFDDQLDRRVALKLIKGGQSEDARKRMLREAQAMAKLSHPNVVPVFEVGEHEGQLFVAMEYVKGVTLARWQTEQERPWQDVVRKYLEAGRGLAAAHAEGLVHRDFKPHNAVVGRDGAGQDGRVRVLDFGLAARRGERELTTHSTIVPKAKDPALDTPLTETGTVMGTPAYMPPEQFLDGKADARSDQFSFCVALWEGLYGARPFAGQSTTELLTNIAVGKVSETPGSAVPTSIRTLLLRGLATKPDERWPDLEALLAGLEHEVGAATRPRLGRAAAIGIVVSVAAVVGLVLVSYFDRAGELRRTKKDSFIKEQAAREEASAARVAERQAVVSKDNTLLLARAALLTTSPTEAAAMLREVMARQTDALLGWQQTANPLRGGAFPLRAVLDGGGGTVVEARLLPGGGDVLTVAETNDGHRIRIAASADGTVRSELDVAEVLALHPEGRAAVVIDAVGSDASVRWFGADAAAPRALDHPGRPSHAVFSPDGTHVATRRGQELRVHAIEGDEGAISIGVETLGPNFALGPGGSHLVAQTMTGSVAVTTADPAAAKSVADKPLTDRPRFAAHGGVAALPVLGVLRILDTSRPGDPLDLPAPGALSMLALSHDGTRVAYANLLTGQPSLVSLDAPDATHALEAHQGETTSVSFSRDGAWLLTTSVDGSARIFATEDARLETTLSGHAAPLTWAEFDEDGRRVVTCSEDGTARVFDVGTARVGREVQPDAMLLAGMGSASLAAITTILPERVRLRGAATERSHDAIPPGHVLHAGAVSADGTRIVLAMADRPGGRGTSPSEPTVRVFDLPSGVAWDVPEFSRRVASVAISPDGTTIAVRHRGTRVSLADADGSSPPRELEFKGARGHIVAFSPDGTRLVVAGGRTTVHDLERDAVISTLEHTDNVNAVAFAPDGASVATGSNEGTVRIVPVDDPEAARELPPHPGRVASVAFSDDGRIVVTTGSTLRRGTHLSDPSLRWQVHVAPVDGAGPVAVLQLTHPVSSARLHPTTGDLVLFAPEKVLTIDRVELSPHLRSLLWRTSFCHSPAQRRALLAETEAVAAEHHARCLELTRLCTTEPFDACHARVTELFGQAP